MLLVALVQGFGVVGTNFSSGNVSNFRSLSVKKNFFKKLFLLKKYFQNLPDSFSSERLFMLAKRRLRLYSSSCFSSFSFDCNHVSIFWRHSRDILKKKYEKFNKRNENLKHYLKEYLGFVSSGVEWLISPFVGDIGEAFSVTFTGNGEAALSLSAPKSIFNNSGRLRLELPDLARRAQERSVIY